MESHHQETCIKVRKLVQKAKKVFSYIKIHMVQMLTKQKHIEYQFSNQACEYLSSLIYHLLNDGCLFFFIEYILVIFICTMVPINSHVDIQFCRTEYWDFICNTSNPQIDKYFLYDISREAGEYNVVAENRHGSSTRAFSLTVVSHQRDNQEVIYSVDFFHFP